MARKNVIVDKKMATLSSDAFTSYSTPHTQTGLVLVFGKLLADS